MIKVKDNNIIAYNASESLIESIIKDVFSGLMLGFCLYISHWADSVFWTFITGLMFLFYLSIKLNRLIKDRVTKFKTWAEFKTWVDEQAKLEMHSSDLKGEE
jgi:hypothetical protein|uniref:Uncharacterized protein n=1 Tax=virus sp. ctn3M15 TaxID=2825821 RepID=A0A8S5RLY4_9VIRU|nr:MAG TPA: hypothetical protein [virus sp. ctn3M15]DAS93356.1 MAG TPA: hypothetical protein [Caudoviricetes sp.]